MDDISTEIRDPLADRERDQRETIMAAIRDILVALGEDPTREGLQDTPLRVAKMYQEIFSGRHQDPRSHLDTIFKADWPW